MTSTATHRIRVLGAVLALIVGAAIAVAALQPPAARPQPAPKREMLQVTVVKIKPELVDQWLEFQKTETIPMLRKAGVKSRDAWTTATFGDGFTYGLVTPIENFAQYDGETPPVRALGADGARAYGEKNRRFVESTRTMAIQTRPDLSYEVKMTGPPKLALLSDITVTPGKAAEFEALLKSDVVPVMRKAHLGYAVSQTMIGGDVSGFTSLILYDNFADIGKGHPFLRVLGAEGERQLLIKAAAFTSRIERRVMRYVPDLSFAPRPTT